MRATDLLELSAFDAVARLKSFTRAAKEREVTASDGLVDIVEEGFDAGVRLGESLSEGMVAVKIKPRLRLVVVGSPQYFRSRSVPKTPRQLAEHVCIQNMYPSGAKYPWEFERTGEEIVFNA